MKLSIFLCAILVSTAFLSIQPSAGQPKSHDDYVTAYAPVADNILAGYGITDGSGKLFTLYAPGYPVILSAIFRLSNIMTVDRLNSIAFFNIFVSAITCLFLFLIAELIFTKKIALIAVLLWMSYPFYLWLVKRQYSEVPFICLMYMATWLFFLGIKRTNSVFSFMAGALFGFSALVRPIGFVYGIIFAFMLLFFNEVPKIKRVICFALLLGGLLLTIFPWEMSVFSSTKDIIPISTNGPDSIKDGLTFGIYRGLGVEQDVVPADVLSLMNRADNADLRTTAGISKFIIQESTHEPKTLFKLLGIKILRSWYGTDWTGLERYVIPIQLVYLSMAIVGLIFAWMAYKDRIYYMVSLIAIILGAWIASICVYPLLRYMVPVMGFVLIFSAVFVSKILKVVSMRGQKAHDGRA